MNKYKYFFKSDAKKESIGVVKAKNPTQALTRAAKKKQLLMEDFLEIFFIEEIKWKIE